MVKGVGGEQSSQQTTRDDVLVNISVMDILYFHVSQHELIENGVGLKICLEMFQGAKVRSFRLAFVRPPTGLFFLSKESPAAYATHRRRE